ncbi:hypothetical protein SUGI_0676720 [Cryptomeria japonica]|nr:hypothetical protein SUGI_0676720 [Cryptomeria japonica]
MEKIQIESCDKLQSITLPTTLISLSIHSCIDLLRVVWSNDLIKHAELIISECPVLEELSSLFTLSYMEIIEIESSDKLQNITLPTTLNSLPIYSCRDLQRVIGSSDLIKIAKLIISEYPELEKLSSFFTLLHGENLDCLCENL